MRYPYPTPALFVAFCVLPGHFLLAQPSLEFAAGAGSGASGSTLSTQMVTLQNNGDNPLGNTFSSFVPLTTVSFALSNQQYSLPSYQNGNHGGVSFGGTSNSGGPLIGSFQQYAPVNSVSGATAGIFSALPVTIGAGMSLAGNYGVELFSSMMGLYNAGAVTNGRYYMGDLTITFSRPVIDPILQLVGVGGTFGSGGSTLGFTSELELQTAGVMLAKLSGSPELSVSSTKILNAAAHPSATTGSGAASGSILAAGINISQLVFKIYVRGDGGYSAWSNASEHTGDAWLVGVSLLSTDIALPVRLGAFTATAQGHSTVLEWTTTTELHADHFSVERSSGGLSWREIGVVKAAGNSTVPMQYSYTDGLPAAGDDLYRLAVVDPDGSTVYSSVVLVAFADGLLRCFPNPARGRVTVVTVTDTVPSLVVMSMDGKLLQRVTGFRSGRDIDLGGYPAGLYLLRILNTDGSAQVVEVQKE